MEARSRSWISFLAQPRHGLFPHSHQGRRAKASIRSLCRMLRRARGAAVCTPCHPTAVRAPTPSQLCRKSRLRPPGCPPLGPAPGSRRGLAALRRELRATTASPRAGPARDPLRRWVERGRRDRSRGTKCAGAAGGTSASGPGSGRATAGGSCSPAVVGGARGSCAVHRGLFHICNNR